MTYRSDGYGQRIVADDGENRRVVAVWRDNNAYHPTNAATVRERAILLAAEISGADAIWRLNNELKNQ